MQSELGNHKDRAADFHDRTIHAILLIRKYTQRRRFLGQVMRVNHQVILFDAQKHNIAATDGADHPALHADASPLYALNQGFHNESGPEDGATLETARGALGPP